MQIVLSFRMDLYDEHPAVVHPDAGPLGVRAIRQSLRDASSVRAPTVDVEVLRARLRT